MIRVSTLTELRSAAATLYMDGYEEQCLQLKAFIEELDTLREKERQEQSVAKEQQRAYTKERKKRIRELSRSITADSFSAERKAAANELFALGVTKVDNPYIQYYLERLLNGNDNH